MHQTQNLRNKINTLYDAVMQRERQRMDERLLKRNKKVLARNTKDGREGEKKKLGVFWGAGSQRCPSLAVACVKHFVFQKLLPPITRQRGSAWT